MKRKPVKHIGVRCSMCNCKLVAASEEDRLDAMRSSTRVKLPPLAIMLGDKPVCPYHYNECERIARHERLKRQERAMRRDRSSLRTMICAGMGCTQKLLGDSERFWHSSLPKEERAKWQFAFDIIDDRPYCAACREPIPTDFAREAPHSQQTETTLAEIEAALGG